MTTQSWDYRGKAYEPRNLVFFLLLVFGLMAIMWVLSTIFHPEKPTSLTDPSVLFWVLVVVPTAIGPTLAAFLMTALTEGKPGVQALWRRFWNRNLSIKWLLVTLLAFELSRLVANLVARMIDGRPYPIIDTSDPFWKIIPVFLAAFITSGMGEEFGGRGYFLPRLQAKWNALTSSIVLGILWAAWHIPVFVIPNISPLYQRHFLEWAPLILLSSVIYTWIFNNTKGSVLAAALIHASVNTSVVVLPTHASHWYNYGFLLLAVVLIVIIFGPENLVRQRPEEAT